MHGSSLSGPLPNVLGRRRRQQLREWVFGEAVERLTRRQAEAELNDRVYALFQLTADEIRLLQRKVEH